MKRDLNVLITTPFGRSIKDEFGDDYTVYKAVVNCLYNFNEQGDTAEAKKKRSDLVNRLVADKGKADLTAEEIVDIKNVCNKMVSTGHFGQVLKVLENDPQ